MASQNSNLSNLPSIAFGEDSATLSQPGPAASDIDSSNPPSSSGIKRRTADIWQHCFYPQSTVIRNKSGSIVWTCRLCKQQYMMSGGTTTIRRHLLNKHRINVQTSHNIRIEGYQQGIDESFARAQAQNEKHRRRRLDRSSSTGEQELDADVLEDLYIQWITAANIPFGMAGNEEFRAYVSLLIIYLFLSLLTYYI